MIFGHLWQSVALAAVLAGVLILGKRMRGETRYGLAAGAFIASLALPLAAFIPGETIVAGLLKQMNAPVSMAGAAPTPAPMAAAAPQAAPVDPNVMQASFERNEAGVVNSIVVAPAAPAAPAAPVAPAAVAAAPAPLFTLPEINLPDLGLPLLAIWLAGVVFLLARTVRDLVAVERLVARATPADLPDALKARMKGVRVLVSPEAPGPMAAGLFKPAIVLPVSIALGSPGMAALLEHEHAHIRRRDMLAALGQRVVLALMWWSPALYWISRRMDEEREVACDEAAVDRTGDAKAFARAMTKQAENQLWVRAPKLAVGAIGPRSQFGRRIKRLIEIAKTGGHPARYSGRLAFAGLALAVAVAAMITPRFTAEAQPRDGQPRDEKSAIDLKDRKAAQRAMMDEQHSDQLDGAPHDIQFQWNGKDFSGFNDEINQMVQSMMPELQASLAGLSPELQAEMAGLSAELASLGAEISAQVSSEMMNEMPAIMQEVRTALQEAGIDPDHMDEWQKSSAFDAEELRQELRQAQEEMKAALGPQLQAEIRRAMEDARQEIASHREDIAAAMRDRQDGMQVARDAMRAARDEIRAARERGEFDVMRNDISYNKRGPKYPMYDAADDCDINVVRELIRDKADVNLMKPGRGSALMAAADNNCPGVAQELIAAGADVNLGFPGKGTPLSIAADNDAVGTVQILLKAGADVNKAMPGKDTPLNTAITEGNLEIVKLLVKKGADVNRASPIGKGSPLKVAERNGEDEVAAYLRSQGAR
jgi:beta-lactamase regulating signal transducer with metallopeptidase domain